MTNLMTHTKQKQTAQPAQCFYNLVCFLYFDNGLIIIIKQLFVEQSIPAIKHDFSYRFYQWVIIKRSNYLAK